MKRNKLFALVPAGVMFALLHTLSATPGHGYVSVSAAAFRPRTYAYQFVNDGNYVVNSNDSSDDWIAPVQLPHGAKVTRIVYHWWDSDAGNDSDITLYRSDYSVSRQSMASLASSGGSGEGSSETTAIVYAVVDNAQYTYFLDLNMSTNATYAFGVTIEYTYPTNLPLILRNFQEAVRGR